MRCSQPWQALHFNQHTRSCLRILRSLSHPASAGGDGGDARAAGAVPPHHRGLRPARGAAAGAQAGGRVVHTPGGVGGPLLRLPLATLLRVSANLSEAGCLCGWLEFSLLAGLCKCAWGAWRLGGLWIANPPEGPRLQAGSLKLARPSAGCRLPLQASMGSLGDSEEGPSGGLGGMGLSSMMNQYLQVRGPALPSLFPAALRHAPPLPITAAPPARPAVIGVHRGCATCVAGWPRAGSGGLHGPRAGCAAVIEFIHTINPCRQVVEAAAQLSSYPESEFMALLEMLSETGRVGWAHCLPGS